MGKEAKNCLYAFLYLLALYLGIKMLPLQRWIQIPWLVFLVQFCLYFGLILLILSEAKKGKMKRQAIQRKSHLLLLVPYLIGASSNLLYGLFFHLTPTIKVDIDLLSVAALTLECVTIEELLFRYIFLDFLIGILKDSKNKRMEVIFFDALAFSLMHCINFFGNNPLNVLLQIGYTFILGCILSSIALITEYPLLPIAGHFLFNFLNTDLVIRIYELDMSRIDYIVFSLSIGMLMIAYTGLLLVLNSSLKKKGDENGNKRNI